MALAFEFYLQGQLQLIWELVGNKWEMGYYDQIIITRRKILTNNKLTRNMIFRPKLNSNWDTQTPLNGS